MTDALPAVSADPRHLALAATGDPRAVAWWAGLDDGRRRDLLTSVDAPTRRDLLFLSDDATALVRSLPAPVMHETVHDLPPADAQAILGCASGAQVGDLLDLDCRRGDAGDQRRFQAWLERLAECGLANREEFWRDLDLDLVADLLRPRVVEMLGEDLAHLADDLGREHAFTPDDVITRHGYGRDDLVDDLLQRLYALDGEVFDRLCRRLLASEAGDTAHAATAGQAERRAGLGLPTPAEAEALEEDIDLPPRPRPSPQPGRTVAAVDPGSFLDRVLTHLTRTGRMPASLGAAILDLANRLIVLRGLGEDDRAICDADRRGALGEIHRRLGLGLEWCAGGDTERGAGLLIGEELLTLCRIGRRLLRDLAAAALLVEDRCRWSGMLMAGDLPTRPGRRPITSLADLEQAFALIRDAG